MVEYNFYSYVIAAGVSILVYSSQMRNQCQGLWYTTRVQASITVLIMPPHPISCNKAAGKNAYQGRYSGLRPLWAHVIEAANSCRVLLLLLQLFIRAKGAPAILGFFTKIMVQKRFTITTTPRNTGIKIPK